MGCRYSSSVLLVRIILERFSALFSSKALFFMESSLQTVFPFRASKRYLTFSFVNFNPSRFTFLNEASLAFIRAIALVNASVILALFCDWLEMGQSDASDTLNRLARF
jgi:hypothetical protein